jgi:hypothetical protein
MSFNLLIGASGRKQTALAIFYAATWLGERASHSSPDSRDFKPSFRWEWTAAPHQNGGG